MAQILGESTKFLEKQHGRHKRISTAAMLFVVFISGIIAAFTLDYAFKNMGFWQKLALFILVFAFYFAIAWLFLLIYSKKKYQSDKYASGISGEQIIFEELKKLPDTYWLLPDISFGQGNVDFIAVSAKGVFVIEAKNHGGTITLERGELLHDQKPFERNILAQSLRQSYAVKDYLAKVRIQAKVIPILVFANPSARLGLIKQDTKGVTVLHQKDLLGFIQNYSAQNKVEAPHYLASLLSKLKKL